MVGDQAIKNETMTSSRAEEIIITTTINTYESTESNKTQVDSLSTL